MAMITMRKSMGAARAACEDVSCASEMAANLHITVAENGAIALHVSPNRPPHSERPTFSFLKTAPSLLMTAPSIVKVGLCDFNNCFYCYLNNRGSHTCYLLSIGKLEGFLGWA